MNRRVILAATIALALAILGTLYTFAQDFDVLRTSASAPYNVLEIGDGHDCSTTSEDGFYIDWSEGNFWFTPVYSYNQAIVSFEWWQTDGPDWYLGGWELPSCTDCQANLYGTYGDWYSTSFTCTCPAIEAGHQYTLSFIADSERFWVRNLKIEVDTQQWYTGTETPSPPVTDCNLDNYSFSDGLEGWSYGEWVIAQDGWVGLHGCTDELNSYIAQTVTLTTTGPSDYYELAISSRNFFPVPLGSEPLLRWKLDSQIPGDSPNWYDGQAHIWEDEYWQINTWVLRGSNEEAITDTLRIWASNREVKIDNVCITLHFGPADITPVCPISPTYTPAPTYTPLPTPTAATSATATAWAATATAWPTPPVYPTVAPPNCDAPAGAEPGFDFIWLAGQILGFLAAFFEAIFRLLANVLQPIFDLIGFIVWLLGAAFSIISALIDLIGSVLQFLLSFLTLGFDLLEIIGAFFRALWQVLHAAPVDPGFEIPEYFAWPIAAWNLLIADTPLELLEPVALAIGSLLMIVWTIRQFSGGTSE
jgi:hypothetical protein